MNDLQIFSNPEFGEIRTIEQNGEPWFVGKDVAQALGYSNASKAVMVHVEDGDKRSVMVSFGADSQNGNAPSGESKTTFINESGLYSLIFGSKLEGAVRFKRWVTSEVLPQIRRTGSYSIVQADPNLPPELAMVEGLLNSMKQMYSTQQRHDKAIEQLTESMDTMKEVMTTDVNGDWRTACGHAIQAVARKLGGGKAYEEAWNEVYTEMERNGFFVRRRLENRKKSAAAQGMSPTYVRKLNALDIIADSKDKKLMSAFINATKKLAAAHSVRMDRLNELPAVEEQPEQTAFDRTCAPAGKLIDTRDAAIRG